MLGLTPVFLEQTPTLFCNRNLQNSQENNLLVSVQNQNPQESLGRNVSFIRVFRLLAHVISRLFLSVHYSRRSSLLHPWLQTNLFHKSYPLPQTALSSFIACSSDARVRAPFTPVKHLWVYVGRIFRVMKQAGWLMPRSRMLGSRNFRFRFSEFRAFQWTRKSELGNLLKFR